MPTPRRKGFSWYAYNLFRAWLAPRSQSDEAVVLKRLAADGPKTFVEFGFHPGEYNCIALTDFQGLLIDGDGDTVRLARLALPRRIRVEHAFLTREDTALITGAFERTGVLSIDIDGNDYWMAEALWPLRPGVVSIEYNSTFGLRPITVPYDPAFERHAKHASGWYHGASLTALCKLAARHDYKLAEVSAGGMNAFFVPQARGDLAALDPAAAFRENTLRRQWSGRTQAEQWAQISHLPYVEV